MQASTLDIEKFRKIRALMERSNLPGEREAARNAAIRMAERAGMTLGEAISIDDASHRTSGKDGDFHRQHEDGLRKRQEEERQRRYTEERERKARERFEEAITTYGPYEDAFEETGHERMLRELLEPLAVYKNFLGSKETYIDGYADWTGYAPSAALVEVLNLAYPIPDSLPGAWEELLQWEELFSRRYAYDEYYDLPVHVRCRIAALESILDTMPVRHWEDFDLRMKWRLRQVENGIAPTYEEQLSAHNTLERDMEILRRQSSSRMDNTQNGQTAQNGHKTTTERRQAVLDVLASSPELSDREIARRCGVSPQTVGNHRKAREADKAQAA